MSSLKKYLVLLLIVFMILVLSDCKFFKSIFSPSDDDNDNSEQCEYPLYPATGNVGDTIRSCHFEVELKWAIRTDEYDGERPRDQENNNLVVFYIRIKLIKLKNWKPLIQRDCFKLQDNQNKTYNYNWSWLTASDALRTVHIAENKEASGTVMFEMPKSSSGFTLIFFIHSTENPENPYEDEIKFNLGF